MVELNLHSGVRKAHARGLKALHPLQFTDDARVIIMLTRASELLSLPHHHSALVIPVPIRSHSTPVPVFFVVARLRLHAARLERCCRLSTVRDSLTLAMARAGQISLRRGMTVLAAFAPWIPVVIACALMAYALRGES